MNAYEQLESMRDLLAEASPGHWSDRELLRRLNVAQRRLAMYIAQQPGGWLLKRASVVPVASEITWPDDCSKPVYLEEQSDNTPVPFTTTVRDRQFASSGVGIKTNFVFNKQRIIVATEDSYTTACYLWYQVRVPDLHVGTAGAGGPASLTLSAYDGAGASTGFGARQVADYYNGSGIQVVSGTGAGAEDTISDYTAARVATVTGTYGADSVYGTVSVLPEECHDLMYMEAALGAMSKPAAAVDPKYFEYLNAVVRGMNSEFSAWAASNFIGPKRTRITELD